MGLYIRLEDSINVVLTKSHLLATALLYAEVKRSIIIDDAVDFSSAMKDTSVASSG